MNTKDFVETRIIYESMLKTPGEIRPASKEVFIEAVKRGVSEGIFGLGIKTEDDKFECKYYKETVSPQLSEGEIIIKPEFCGKEEGVYAETPKGHDFGESSVLSSGTIEGIYEPDTPNREELLSSIRLKFTLPLGQISTLAQMVKFLNEKFSKCEIKIELTAEGGKISKSEYENKIKETLNQLGLSYEEETFPSS
jgi:hypothetical protein